MHSLDLMKEYDFMKSWGINDSFLGTQKFIIFIKIETCILQNSF